MSKPNPLVDTYLSKNKKWQAELKKLRNILLNSGLTEELKWSKPCYTFQDHNLVVILPLKKYCAMVFFKGALLKNTSGLLIKPTENTNAGRQIRFTNVAQITKAQSALKSIIQDAIKIEKAGLKVPAQKNPPLIIPEEFNAKLHEMPELKEAFDALTPGRQRGYILYFSAPKQSKTRESRIEKCIDLILDGEGLHDQFISKSK